MSCPQHVQLFKESWGGGGAGGRGYPMGSRVRLFCEYVEPWGGRLTEEMGAGYVVGKGGTYGHVECLCGV